MHQLFANTQNAIIQILIGENFAKRTRYNVMYCPVNYATYQDLKKIKLMLINAPHFFRMQYHSRKSPQGAYKFGFPNRLGVI